MRAEKKDIVKEVQERLRQSPYMIVVNYAGMKVGQFMEIRDRLHGAKARMHVVKNRFVRRAMKDLGMPDVSKALTGQTAIVYGEEDVVGAAKVLKAFFKEFDRAISKLGVVGDTVMTAEDLARLADLPPLNVLRSRLIGIIQAPAAKLATLVNTPAVQIVTVLNAKVEKES
jgi:large subunit ribosomal protein L10